MNIPFRVKLLTETAKAPEQPNDGDLWDLFADDFCVANLQDGIIRNEIPFDESYHFDWHLSEEDKIITKITHYNKVEEPFCKLNPQGRILVKTGIALELPVKCDVGISVEWLYKSKIDEDDNIICYAVADLRPRSGLALKHGITVLNSPATIDNSYRKEIGVILYNAGHKPYTINKGDKIAQMLIRPLYTSNFEIVKDFEDTGRGGYGSTGR